MRIRPVSRRRGLAWRLASTILLPSLLVIILLSVTVYLAIALYLGRQLEREIDAQAKFYAAYAASLAPDESTLAGLAPAIVGLFAPQADLTVRLFAASSGALLAATQDIGSQPSRAALVELRYRSPTAFTQSSRDLPSRRYAAQPVTRNTSIIGVVEVSRSTLDSERFLSSLQTILLIAVLVAAVLCVLAGVALARDLSRPILEIEQATRRISNGDLEFRLDVNSGDEIGLLAQSINDMAGRLQQLETARAQFISEISHDLRTPLAAIKGLLVNMIDEASTDERPSLELAERETDRLVRLVNQLLDFARWRGGRLELTRRSVDVGAVARDAIGVSEARASYRNIALGLDVPSTLPQLTADADRIQRVILNLLDNAIKFTGPGGRVVLAVAPRESEIQVSVADTGRGMTDEERKRAFEPYYRGEGGGAGLGLAIARAVVEAHGGRMGLESEPDHGCRVWFTLPL